MEFRVLGPVEVRCDGRSVGIGGPKPTALLAALLIRPGEVVSLDRIVETLWGEEPPPSATALVQTYIARLRRTLDEAEPGTARMIETRAPGYVMRLRPEQSDLERFRLHLARAREALRAERFSDAADELSAGLALWRGRPLEGVSGTLADIEAVGLEEQRLIALEERVEADLVLGRHTALVAELTELVQTYPYRERLRGRLMVALYRSGRRSDALAVYRAGREKLVNDQGLEPGAALQDLHTAILDGTLQQAPAGPTAPDAEPPAVVHTAINLPPDIGDFVGREKYLDRIRDLLTGGPSEEGARIVSIVGKPGAGKTSLAVRLAHRLRDEFPDGRLLVNLDGAEGRPSDPFEVLGRLLGALGVDGKGVGANLDERVDRWRMRVADRRVLLVLDNASEERQVRPLLTGSPGCAVLITSRARLAGLEGVATVELPVMPEEQALELLGRLAGPERVAADPAAATALAQLCGRLPLAIRIAGARLAARPHWTLGHLVDRLRDEHGRLDELTAGDLAVRASLALSYRSVPESGRRLLRLLAHLGTGDFAGWIAAALLEEPLPRAEDVLESLVDAQLLEVAGTDACGRTRYGFHDLIRIFALERAEAEDPTELRPAAERAFDACVALLDHAAGLAPRHVLPLTYSCPTRTRPDVATLERLTEQPNEWLVSEEPALLDAVESAVRLGFDEHACALAAGLVSSSLARRNQFDAWERSHSAALRAVRDAGNLRGEGTVLCGLGHLRYKQDRYEDAGRYYHAALRVFERVGDRKGEAIALFGLGRVPGPYAERLDRLNRAAEAFGAGGNTDGVAATWYQVGAIQRDRGEFDEALQTLRRAADTYREAADHRGEGLAVRGISLVHRARGALDDAERENLNALGLLALADDALGLNYANQSLAKVYLRQGRTCQAEALLERCLETARHLNDTFGIALVLRTLGELYLATSRLERALQSLSRSLEGWDALELLIWKGRTLRDIGAVHAMSGDFRAADEAWDRAQAILDRLDGREARELPEWRSHWLGRATS